MFFFLILLSRLTKLYFPDCPCVVFAFVVIGFYLCLIFPELFSSTLLESTSYLSNRVRQDCPSNVPWCFFYFHGPRFWDSVSSCWRRVQSIFQSTHKNLFLWSSSWIFISFLLVRWCLFLISPDSKLFLRAFWCFPDYVYQFLLLFLSFLLFIISIAYFSILNSIQKSWVNILNFSIIVSISFMFFLLFFCSGIDFLILSIVILWIHNLFCVLKI